MKTIILSGPTASGKSALALDLARMSGKIEIINADSLLFYRGMDIGTAKPSREEQAEVPHHLIDIRNPDEPLTAGDFVREALKTLDEIESRGHRGLIVGGSGFYLKALLYGLWEAPPADPAIRAQLEAYSNHELFTQLMEVDSEAALRISAGDKYRLVRALEIYRLTGNTPTQLQSRERQTPDERFALWMVDRDPSELDQRVAERCTQMLAQDWVEETRELLKSYSEARAMKAVGYQQIRDYLEGRLPEGRKIKPGLEGLRSEVELATRQLVKKQRTWFNSETHKTSFQLPRDHVRILEEFRTLYRL